MSQLKHAAPKILLLGANGQLGWELQRSLACLGELIALDRRAADLSMPDALLAAVRHYQPTHIVNAAAYTAVDKAETDVALARTINATAPSALAQYAARSKATLIHFSTDYVFDGSGHQARIETDPTGPLSVYGQTKWEGEELIRASGCQHLIFRTSWVYAARGGNFAKTMLRFFTQREELKVIADQIGAPTGADLIADITSQALRQLLLAPTLSGTYHLVANGQTSWHGYASFLLDWARAQGQPIKTKSIQAIASSEYPMAAQRPLNSRLATHKLQETFGMHLPNWQTGVLRMLSEISPDSTP